MILFKRQPDLPQIEREYAQLDPRLRKICDVMAYLAWTLYGDDLVITRIYDPNGPGTTHKGPKPYRHLDFALLERGESERLRGMVNAIFPYGVSGFDTIPPLDHGTAPHFHVQVKP